MPRSAGGKAGTCVARVAAALDRLHRRVVGLLQRTEGLELVVGRDGLRRSCHRRQRRVPRIGVLLDPRRILGLDSLDEALGVRHDLAKAADLLGDLGWQAGRVGVGEGQLDFLLRVGIWGAGRHEVVLGERDTNLGVVGERIVVRLDDFDLVGGRRQRLVRLLEAVERGSDSVPRIRDARAL